MAGGKVDRDFMPSFHKPCIWVHFLPSSYLQVHERVQLASARHSIREFLFCPKHISPTIRLTSRYMSGWNSPLLGKRRHSRMPPTSAQVKVMPLWRQLAWCASR